MLPYYLFVLAFNFHMPYLGHNMSHYFIFFGKGYYWFDLTSLIDCSFFCRKIHTVSFIILSFLLFILVSRFRVGAIVFISYP